MITYFQVLSYLKIKSWIHLYIVVVVLGSIHIQSFEYLTVAWVKVSLFLELIRDILILGIGPIQGLDDTTLTAEAESSINFSR